MERPSEDEESKSSSPSEPLAKETSPTPPVVRVFEVACTGMGGGAVYSTADSIAANVANNFKNVHMGVIRGSCFLVIESDRDFNVNPVLEYFRNAFYEAAKKDIFPDEGKRKSALDKGLISGEFNIEVPNGLTFEYFEGFRALLLRKLDLQFLLALRPNHESIQKLVTEFRLKSDTTTMSGWRDKGYVIPRGTGIMDVWPSYLHMTINKSFFSLPQMTRLEERIHSAKPLELRFNTRLYSGKGHDNRDLWRIECISNAEDVRKFREFLDGISNGNGDLLFPKEDAKGHANKLHMTIRKYAGNARLVQANEVDITITFDNFVLAGPSEMHDPVWTYKIGK